MTMEFEEISEIIFRQITPKLESNQGVSIFAKERAKFEGWLKVELCDSLVKYFQVVPEKNRVDITFNGWAVELKTVNTNIRYENVKNKTRPITKNVQGVIDDIEKLKSTNYPQKAILFVVFPINHDNQFWQIQLRRISTLLRKINHKEFRFRDEIPGVTYFGLI